MCQHFALSGMSLKWLCVSGRCDLMTKYGYRLLLTDPRYFHLLAFMTFPIAKCIEHHETQNTFLFFIQCSILSIGDRSSSVVNVLCYKSEGHWFDSSWCQLNIFIDIKSFRSHYGPGADSASCTMCTVSFPGVKCGRACC